MTEHTVVIIGAWAFVCACVLKDSVTGMGVILALIVAIILSV